MKLPGIIVSLILLTGIMKAQVPADSLLELEYRIFKAGNEDAKQALLLQKVNLYWRWGQTDLSLQATLKRLNPETIKDPVTKSRTLWNAALSAYINDDAVQAQSYLRQYRKMTGDSSTAALFLQALTEKFRDSSGFINTVSLLCSRDSVFKGLLQFHRLAFYERKHRMFYQVSSALVPGSGTIMNGDIGRGLVSLALACSSVYGISQLLQSALYVNASGWTLGMGLRFYTGNLRLTAKTFERRQLRQKKKMADVCEEMVRQLLQKYPLNLRA